MLSFLERLPLPWIHKNGKAQETGASESLKETPLTKVEESNGGNPNYQKEFLVVPELVQEVTSPKDPLFHLVRVITEIEELVVQTYARITKAQVEFKTGRDGTRYLQIHFAVDRKMNKKQLAKLRKQVIARVALRVDSRIKVVAFELKDTPQNDSNDSSS
ncbi:hypothetical protein IIB49_01415 [Patescibacteria group bacterium]|nr:hypothetical protein [Patescibacteria group bacterium]